MYKIIYNININDYMQLDKVMNNAIEKIKKENEYDHKKMINMFRRQESMDNLRGQLVF